MINRWWYYNCWDLHVHNICINKLWDLRSYFLYLHRFLLTLFSSITVQFSMFFHVSNLIQTFQTDWVDSSTQSSLVIYNSFSTDYPLSCHWVSPQIPWALSLKLCSIVFLRCLVKIHSIWIRHCFLVIYFESSRNSRVHSLNIYWNGSTWSIFLCICCQYLSQSVASLVRSAALMLSGYHIPALAVLTVSLILGHSH